MAPGHFERWMGELDALHELRERDPALALARLQEQEQAWHDLCPAEAALLQARAMLHRLSTHLTLGEHEAARPLCDELDQQLLAPLLQAPPPPLQRAVYRVNTAAANARAFLAHGTGDFAQALRAYQRALDAAVAAHDRPYQARVRVNMANTFEECGLPAQALDEQAEALRLARELDMPELVADLLHNMGNAMASLGRHEEGLVSNRRALSAFTELGLSQKQAYALLAIAERLLELGRADEAAQALDQSQATPMGYENLPYLGYLAYLAGRVSVARGRPEEARQNFERAAALATGPAGDRAGHARAQLQLAQLDQAQGRLDAAWAQANEALQPLQGLQAHRESMQAHQLLSQLAKQRGDLAAALGHHEAYHEHYARSFNEDSARRAQLLAVRHELDLARGEAERQRLENARLNEALATIAERLGPALHADAAAARAGREPRPEDLQGLGLTPREAEVLHWVACGKTNEDVAQILGTGLSGVKKHLRSIFDKLGVDNRTAAANAVRQRQLR